MPRRPIWHRRLALIVAIVLAATLLALLAAMTWLDPGSKNDRSTGLVTPTLAARSARVFAVAADESRVEFTASVRGVPLAGVFPVERGTITLEPVGEARVRGPSGGEVRRGVSPYAPTSRLTRGGF